MKKLMVVVILVILVVSYFYINTQGFWICFKYDISVCEVFEYDKMHFYLKTSNDNYDKFIDFFNVEIINKFCINDRAVVEGYSNKLKNFVVINGRKINIQFSIFDDIMLVGYPLIKKSF